MYDEKLFYTGLLETLILLFWQSVVTSPTVESMGSANGKLTGKQILIYNQTWLLSDHLY